MLEFFRNKRIMVVVAHPDDELLGLGATMHKLINNYGVKTHVVILGEGITSRSDNRDPDKWKIELEEHRQNVHAAKNVIGYHSVNLYDFPDNRFDTIALLDLVKVIEKEKNAFRPDMIFTHHGGDLNVDHQRTFDAVMTSTRPMVGETVNSIIAFETASSTEWRASTDPRYFNPNLFISLEKGNIEAKVRAMECYQFERRNYPHPRSPEALDIQSKRWAIAVGVAYAEAFQIVRLIN